MKIMKERKRRQKALGRKIKTERASEVDRNLMISVMKGKEGRKRGEWRNGEEKKGKEKKGERRDSSREGKQRGRRVR